MATYTTNPFADPAPAENPFESTTSLPKPQVDDREAALNAREADLARRERELALQNGQLKNWPKFYPLIYHDISQSIPAESQSILWKLFYTWQALLVTLLINLLGTIFLLIAGASGGAKDMIGAVVDFVLLPPLSFFLWYRPAYWGYNKEQAFIFYLFYFFAAWHFLFCVYQAVGIPSTGSAGIINTISMFAQGHILAGVFGAIASAGWVFQAIAIFFLYRLVWNHGKEQGHTIDTRSSLDSLPLVLHEKKEPCWRALRSVHFHSSSNMPVTHPKVADNVVHKQALRSEGSSAFSNLHLLIAVVGVPKLLQWTFPILNRSWIYWTLLVLMALPVLIVYWAVMSKFGGRRNEKVTLPGKPIDFYLDFKTEELKKKWHGKKIPIQVLYDLYFDKQVDFKGDVLDVLEYRHDFASYNFTIDLFKYVFFTFAPEVIMHTETQDMEQVRGHYDRGDDFYEWFLGPRMIYTSGVVRNIDEPETLEQLQDNKLQLVCEKLDLQPTDKLLDIGCGWGTLAAFAGKNYGCDVTGVTLGVNQAAFGTKRLRDNGVSEEKGRILCTDFRHLPPVAESYTKIVSLEMAEHVGIRRYSAFLKQVYNLLDDDGTFVFQVAGLRPYWQFEDLIWGLFMNKYVFPGADASIPLHWVIKELEVVGFEVKSIDVLGVHYSATLYRWYQNWLGNKSKVLEKYGERWFRIWTYFLASATIASRDGSASVFQITLHKNLNAYQRIEGVPSHTSLRFSDKEIKTVV